MSDPLIDKLDKLADSIETMASAHTGSAIIAPDGSNVYPDKGQLEYLANHSIRDDHLAKHETHRSRRLEALMSYVGPKRGEMSYGQWYELWLAPENWKGDVDTIFSFGDGKPFADLVRIITSGVKGSMRKAELHAVRNHRNDATHGLPSGDEFPDAVALRRVDSGTSFSRLVLRISTSVGGRRFCIDPGFPVNPRRMDSPRRVRVTMWGGSKRTTVHPGTFEWISHADTEAGGWAHESHANKVRKPGKWEAMRFLPEHHTVGSAGAYGEESQSDLGRKMRIVPPEPQHDDPYEEAIA